MPLRVLTGVANAGKTGVIHAALRGRVAAGEHALLLLPSPADVGRAMAELSWDCPTRLEITTLGSHLDGCWRVVGDGRRLVTPVQRAVVLEESVSRLDAGLLAGSVTTPGFRRMLARLVQRAAETDFTPDCQEPCGEDRGSHLLRYIEAYRSALHGAGLIERGEAYRVVARNIEALDLPGLIAVNRFTGLTGPQESYIVAAARHREVMVSLTYSSSLPATEAAKPLVTRLSAVGHIEEIAPGHSDSGSAELAILDAYFSTDVPGAMQVRGAVTASEAWGRPAEAARIAAEVQEALAAGIRPGEIAIIFRDPADHIRPLRSALDEISVSADWDIQIPFERAGLGRVLLGLLAVCAGSADRVVWMDVMRSPYSPMPPHALDELDARIRRAGVRGVEAARRLDSWVTGDTAVFLREARNACSRSMDDGSEARWHALTMAMMGRAYPAGGTLSPEGLLDAAAARAFIDAVAGLRVLPHVEAPAWTLGTALRGTPVSVGDGLDSGRVQVMSAERVRGRRFKCVIVGGLTAGEFPRIRRDEGYGALGVEAALEKAGVDIAPRDDVSAERLLFYQVITRARERLVLSRRSHDDSGQPVQPSIFLEEVLDLYERDGSPTGAPEGVRRVVLGLDAGCSATGAPCTSRREARSAARDRNPALASTMPTVGEDVTRHPCEGAGYVALGEEASAALRTREVFSVSDIETYLQCPYRWYIERVIRPAELDGRVDASQAGQAAHAVLSLVYDRFIAETEQGRILPETLPVALGLLPGVIDEVLSSVHPQTAQEVADLRRAMQSVAAILSADATLLPGYEPRYREWSFGMEEGDEPEELDGYALRGRIDRVDCSGSHLVITDYKLGSVGSERGVSKFTEKGLVQLPLYAYIASRRFDLEVAGGVYRSITHGDLRGFVTEGLRGKPFVSTDVVGLGEIERVMDDARGLAAGAVQGMRAGCIDAEPADGRCSPYCAARHFCPGREVRHA